MVRRGEKGSLLLLVVLAGVIALLAMQVKPAVAARYTAKMEKAVRAVVNDRSVAPGLVRLLFHDCFVRGCDGSVLLVSTPTDIAGQTEKDSPKNGNLRGLDLIQKIRDAVLNMPGGVNISCADAVVFAAREATFLLSNSLIEYPIDGPGRNDGVISSAQDPDTFLPGSTDNFAQLLASFTAKPGFRLKELVALSGTHSTGVCHSESFADRLTPDVVNRTEIDFKYQQVILKERDANPNGAFLNNIRDMKKQQVKSSHYSASKAMKAADGVLDNSFYNANLQNMVRFKSDWELRTNTNALALMQKYNGDFSAWVNDFSAAMTKLSNTLTSEGPVFEVGFRKDCTRTNFESYPPPTV